MITLNSLRKFNFNINTRILVHCIAVIVLTCLVSWFQIKPYGILFLILLVFWVYKTRCAASIKIIPPPELSAKYQNIYDKLIKLRNDRPTIFCAIISSILAILAIIGHLLSGSNVVIFGLILSALISTKYNFKILKVPNKEKVTWVDLGDNDDEFLPEVNETNLFVLQRASEEAVITGKSSENNDDEEKSDEVPCELLIPDLIPEIDENSEGSSDDELIPKIPGEISQSYLKNQNFNKIDNDNGNKNNSLEFKRGYFKKDSSISTSSSDDESLSKGLNFQECSFVDGKSQLQLPPPPPPKNQTVLEVAAASAAILPNLVNVFSVLNKNIDKQHDTGTLVTTHLSSSSSNNKLIESSDESDFEILYTDDLNSP